MLNNWDKDKSEKKAIQAGKDLHSDQQEFLHEKDPIIILATKINSVNTKDYNEFVCAMQFDTEELETYAQAMQGLNAT